MKVWICEDEYYPVYFFLEGFGFEVDLPEEIVKRWEKANEEWGSLQAILKGYHDSARHDFFEQERINDEKAGRKPNSSFSEFEKDIKKRT